MDTLLAALDAIRRAFGRFNQSVPAATVTSSATVSPNLLFNGDAEIGDPSESGFTTATLPGWTIVSGAPTVIAYGTQRTIWSVGQPFAMPDLPNFLSFPQKSVGPSISGTPTGGNNFFGGGPVVDAVISQTVDLSAASAAIDTGTVGYNLSAWLGGYTLDPSAASVKVTFLDAGGNSLGSDKLRKVGLLDRFFATKFKERTATGLLPVDTRSAVVEVTFNDKNPIIYGLNARYNDAFADNISFTVDAALSAPMVDPPVSTVGALDHVFMVYMENKGYSDIVGSKNAPYLNSLIEQYGFADNYFALTHGSLPNYYPIVAGSNYGITYNCASPCIYTTNLLTTNLDNMYGANGWRGYAQSLEPGANPLVDSGDYSNDQLPFPAFKAIAGDLAYAKAHILPLEQMAIDLSNPADAPKFAWWAANEDFNGEGPVSGISGVLRFALNQLDPRHQYNVAALDQFLSETVPVILNSATWNDVTVKSAVVVTFDEDNNNLYLGFGNEGNHIVTVVIPSPGAVAAGMKSGSFTTSQYYDHYGLLRTIEEALGLPYLTANDEWAVPLNDFWT
ncbi:MAG: phosphoesterase [Mycobacterium sp.]|nr:phosphoesterase [Mycobacterium sp.]